MRKNSTLIIIFLLLTSKCFSLIKVEIPNKDFIISKVKTKSEIVQEYLYDNYDESRFETSILKINDNNSLVEYFYYLEEGLLKCLAIYQFPEEPELNGILLINDERKISDRVIIKLDEQKKGNNFVYITWNPENDYFLDKKLITKVKIKINYVTKEIIIPIKTILIDLTYQGKLEMQELDFENFNTLQYLKMVRVNYFSNPKIKTNYPFDIVFVQNNHR